MVDLEQERRDEAKAGSSKLVAELNAIEDLRRDWRNRELVSPEAHIVAMMLAGAPPERIADCLDAYEALPDRKVTDLYIWATRQLYSPAGADGPA